MNKGGYADPSQAPLEKEEGVFICQVCESKIYEADGVCLECGATTFGNKNIISSEGLSLKSANEYSSHASRVMEEKIRKPKSNLSLETKVNSMTVDDVQLPAGRRTAVAGPSGQQASSEASLYHMNRIKKAVSEPILAGVGENSRIETKPNLSTVYNLNQGKQIIPPPPFIRERTPSRSSQSGQ